MRILYFDAFAGISGDMTVGALLAAGVPFEHVREALRGLDIDGYQISSEPRQSHGISATKFDVRLDAAEPAHHGANHSHDHHDHGHHDHGHHQPVQQHPHRAYREIRRMLETSRLDAAVRQRALRIFEVLAQAEGQIHDKAIDEVTFHEVGAVDSIVDIVAAAVAIEYLKPEKIYVSELPLGSGIVKSQHGPIPVPAPATAELLKGFATRLDGEGELVTPTGAAILAALACHDAVPAFRTLQIGYGAGSRVQRDRPNLLRLLVGETEGPVGTDRVVVIETNIDDLNPEFYDHVSELLFAAGARDVFLVPVQMKKNRPGVILTVVAAVADRDRLATIVLNETSAIGVRFSICERTTLVREVREVTTDLGVVRVKLATRPDGSINIAPEYDDCHRLAHQHGVALRVVFEAAVAAARA